LPGQDAWITPELLEDEELEDDELDEDEVDEDELDDELDEDELDDDELDDDEESVGVAPPQPPTANNTNVQTLAIASFAVYMPFMQPLFLLLDVSTRGAYWQGAQNICAISCTTIEISICIRNLVNLVTALFSLLSRVCGHPVATQDGWSPTNTYFHADI